MYLGEPIPMMIKSESDDYDEINYNKKNNKTKENIHRQQKKKETQPLYPFINGDEILHQKENEGHPEFSSSRSSIIVLTIISKWEEKKKKKKKNKKKKKKKKVLFDGRSFKGGPN